MFGNCDQKGVFVCDPNFGCQTRLLKKQTAFVFYNRRPLFPSRFRFVGWWRTAGRGHLPPGKSLLENLHEAGGGQEAWEAKNKITEGDDLRRRTRKSSRESVSMACPSSPDPSSYSLSDMLPPSTILTRVSLARLFAVNLQHKMLVRVFHYGKAKKSGWNSFIS